MDQEPPPCTSDLQQASIDGRVWGGRGPRPGCHLRAVVRDRRRVRACWRPYLAGWLEFDERADAQ